MMRTSILWKVLGTSMFTAVVIMACQKHEQPANHSAKTPATTSTAQGLSTQSMTTQPLSPFTIYVGGPIDTATAQRYKKRMIQQLAVNTSMAPLPAAFYLPADALADPLGINGAVGICFYYGQDNSGALSLIPIAIDGKGYVLQAKTVTTTLGVVDWPTAKQWRLNFQASHPSATWGNFSGTIVLKQLLAEGSKLVRLEPGINDEGSQTLISSNGDVVSPSVDYDRGVGCPPFCGSGF